MGLRRDFRIKPPDPSKVQVQVQLPSGTTTDALVVDIGAGGCQLRFSKPDAPAIPLGQEYMGSIGFSEAGTVFDVKLRPIGRVETLSVRNYSFELILSESVRDSFLDSLSCTFNRRLAPRVKPDPITAIKVIVSRTDGRDDCRGRIRDMSESGIAVHVDMEAENALSDAELLRVRLGLATEAVPLDLDALVVGRAIVNGGLLYRMQFILDPETDPAGENMRTRLAHYIEHRKRDLARAPELAT